MFNRDREPFVQIPRGQTFRYAHKQCYLDKVNAGQEKGNYTIWDPTVTTTCFWCHEAIYPYQSDVMEMPQLKGKYVHRKCAEIHPADEKEKLLVYLIQTYDLKEGYIIPKYMMQLQEYAKTYQFTYSGMLKTLQYWHEVKKQPFNPNYGLGIIPHLYNEARNYYYWRWQAEQINKDKNIEDYVPKDMEVVITPPQRQIPKRKLFTFLDEEEINGE